MDTLFHLLLNNKKLNFESEILFFIDEFDTKDYKLVFNYESGKINISYDESFYSKELMDVFLESIDVLLDKFTINETLLNSISIRREIELEKELEQQVEEKLGKTLEKALDELLKGFK